MYVSLLPVVEACVVAAVRGRVGEVRVAADELRACDRPQAPQERHYSSCGMEPFPCLRPMARGILGGVPPRPDSPPVDTINRDDRRTQPNNTKYYGIHQSIAVRGGLSK